MAAIARELGLAQNAIYSYFPSDPVRSLGSKEGAMRTSRTALPAARHSAWSSQMGRMVALGRAEEGWVAWLEPERRGERVPRQDMARAPSAEEALGRLVGHRETWRWVRSVAARAEDLAARDEQPAREE